MNQIEGIDLHGDQVGVILETVVMCGHCILEMQSTQHSGLVCEQCGATIP